jgi:predicted ATPase/class 3 adenylate cyclase
LVSVLFADLVGFTTLTEARDAEDARELLSLYFETARTVIDRYGGTVEKFIGDAVMAVWGAPIANEDDAERAVRAALELVDAVPALDPGLAARAGVLTGEAAVTVGAQGQGMVAGDLVNTASRIQSASDAGGVLVGETTKRASEAAIVYTDAGLFELKGKAETMQLWRAARVVASRRGEGRTAGLEAPFVGRERELRLVKEALHTTADDRRASLVSVVGVAGIGKSRLAWELEKYIDGLVDTIWWHRGRCLSYGDGVAYWALAEMVRMRALIAEDDPAGEAIAKLRAAVELHVSDPDEREWIAPRLQHLLGLTERVAPDQEDLFSAWRLFFERMAETAPIALVFEDLHWADSALLDFIEYLLDWSRNHPLFVLTLSRPELGERHPTFGTRVRNATALMLDPLDDDAMDALLRGLVPGMPDELRTTIRDRADGIPLYAVETVRMLLDRGLLEPAADGYRMRGSIEDLEVPETLHALIAARLDGLDAAERRAVENAAVLGKTFSARGLAAISDISTAELEPTLASLVRKDLLVLQTDPRSPERGQYGFLQALIQRVAYETLSRRDRKALHLAAAHFLEQNAGVDPDEIAEVIAAHYRDADSADPDAEDARDIRAQAREWLCRAGERAASLAAIDDAQRAFEAAATLVDDDLEHARLLEQVGKLAGTGNRLPDAEEHLRRALELCERAGATHDAARVSAQLGLIVWQLGRLGDAIQLMENALAVLAATEMDGDVATLTAQLGRLHFFAGDNAAALARIEAALEVAESQEIPELLASALNTKSLVLRHRPHESRALMNEALRIALEHDLAYEALRAYNNLLVQLDEADESEKFGPLLDEALALARRRGDRFWEMRLTVGLCWDARNRGEFDEAIAFAAGLPDGRTEDSGVAWAHCQLARIELERGRPEKVREWTLLNPHPGDVSTLDKQMNVNALWTQAIEEEAAGDLESALATTCEAVESILGAGQTLGLAETLRTCATLAVAIDQAARGLEVASSVDALPPAVVTRPIASQLHRLRANAAAAAGDNDAAANELGLALAAARNLGQPYWLAPVLVDYGRWLVETDRQEEGAPLLEEARELFERMGATAWLERIDAVRPRQPSPTG